MSKYKNEINTILQKGYSFNIRMQVSEREKGLLGYFKRPQIKEVLKTYKIPELTLSTLDRISSVSIDFDELAGANMPEFKEYAVKHSRSMAKIIAYAVLGEKYLIRKGNEYIKNDKELKELEEVFFVCLKPSEMLNICNAINVLGNMPDFIASIRLMSTANTIVADRVE